MEKPTIYEEPTYDKLAEKAESGLADIMADEVTVIPVIANYGDNNNSYVDRAGRKLKQFGGRVKRAVSKELRKESNGYDCMAGLFLLGSLTAVELLPLPITIIAGGAVLYEYISEARGSGVRAIDGLL